jgi:hypothetical protein
VWSGCWADVTIRYCEIKSEHKYIIEYLGNKMDLKALMQKLEVIDKKQNLMEAEKKETTWTDKSGKKHPATQVKGDKYTGKEAEKEDKKKADEGISFTSGIAQALLREFGLEEAPVTNPWANDPAKSAAWTALSPQDQEQVVNEGEQQIIYETQEQPIEYEDNNQEQQQQVQSPFVLEQTQVVNTNPIHYPAPLPQFTDFIEEQLHMPSK